MVSDLSKDKVHWTKQMNLALAKYMEDKPHIWDTKHPQFSNMGLRDETFANFANKYQGLNWQAAKERWTNIRSTYGFYIRKVHAKKAKGEDFKVNWFMWQPCKYLYKVHKFVKQTKASKDVKDEEDESDDNDNANTRIQFEDSDDEYLSTTARTSMNSQKSTTTRTSITCNELVNNLYTVLANKQNNQFVIDRSQYAQIGEAVTTKLNELNSYDAARLSQKILEILAEYDENNPMNPNNA